MFLVARTPHLHQTAEPGIDDNVIGARDEGPILKPPADGRAPAWFQLEAPASSSTRPANHQRPPALLPRPTLLSKVRSDGRYGRSAGDDTTATAGDGYAVTYDVHCWRRLRSLASTCMHEGPRSAERFVGIPCTARERECGGERSGEEPDRTADTQRLASGSPVLSLG